MQTTEPAKPGDFQQTTRAGSSSAGQAPPSLNAPQEGEGSSSGQAPGISRLFQPEKPNKEPAGTANPRGVQPAPNARLTRGGQAGRANEEEKMDPTERAAVRRLEQAVQRIQANRERRTYLPGGIKEDPANLKNRRDW